MICSTSEKIVTQLIVKILSLRPYQTTVAKLSLVKPLYLL